jgi:hypothetical protein
MDKVKYIINCNGKKTIFNSEEKYENFKQENLNYTFTEKRRIEGKFAIIEIDMNNNPIPLPDPKDPTIKELAKTVNGLTCTVDALTNTNKEIMKTLTDFIKKQEQFNARQEQFNKEQKKFNKKLVKLNNLKI